MARMNQYQPLYDAFRIFVDNCILQDRSVIWPDQEIWTLSNLERWEKQVFDAPNIEGDLNFNEKLEKQLAGVPKLLWGLVSDLYYVYYLPSSNITFPTRKLNISWAALNGGLTLPPEQDPIWTSFTPGFTRTTIRYHFRFAQFHLLVAFALQLKRQENASEFITDSSKIKFLLDGIVDSIPRKSDRPYDMRHAILYLMFPDEYERIISTGHKEKIAEFYKDMISNPEPDLDKRLNQIRHALVKSHPDVIDLDFYKDLRQEWDNDEPKRTPPDFTPPDGPDIISTDTTTTREGLRLLKRFKNIILFGPPGTGKTYWANIIANRLIEPQLKQAQSKVAFLGNVIEELPFYDVLALGMYSSNADQKFIVPELVNMDLLQARFRSNPVKHPTNQIWGYLQTHTAPDSQTVNLNLRAEPYIFDKTSDSRWFLTDAGKDYVQSTLADRLNLIKQGPPPTNKPEDFIRFITFHQTYAYEDFVEGLRPRTDQSDSGVLTFEVKPGIFRSLCARAQDDPDNLYVLVIDEINRGNIAKVFGELMTLIEVDKRDKLSVELPYSKEVFHVPANLAIIGTMNTADRSIALLDVALRRRFAFIELLPESELLDSLDISSTEEDPVNLGECLRKINKRIVELRGSDYQIGHSYFLPIKHILENEDKLAYLDDIWNYQIMPLLKEYFYGQIDLLRQVLPSFFNQLDEQEQQDNGPEVLHKEELIAALNKL